MQNNGSQNNYVNYNPIYTSSSFINFVLSQKLKNKLSFDPILFLKRQVEFVDHLKAFRKGFLVQKYKSYSCYSSKRVCYSRSIFFYDPLTSSKSL